MITSSDGVFTVTIGPQSSSEPRKIDSHFVCQASNEVSIWMPPARMNCLLTVNGGLLYLYGGIYEEGDVQVTLTDLYSLDINKQNKWNTIIEMDRKNQVRHCSILSIIYLKTKKNNRYLYPRKIILTRAELAVI